MPEWTADAQTYLQNDSAMEIEEETEMYTELSYLNSAPLCKYLFYFSQNRRKEILCKMRSIFYQRKNLQRSH